MKRILVTSDHIDYALPVYKLIPFPDSDVALLTSLAHVTISVIRKRPFNDLSRSIMVYYWPCHAHSGNGREVCIMAGALTLLILTVVASVVSHHVCKWLNRKKNK